MVISDLKITISNPNFGPKILRDHHQRSKITNFRSENQLVQINKIRSCIENSLGAFNNSFLDIRLKPFIYCYQKIGVPLFNPTIFNPLCLHPLYYNPVT